MSRSYRLRAPLVRLLVATAAVAAVLPVQAAGARPSGASDPSASVAALRAEVARTADRLAAATVAWERGQQRLGQLISLEIGTEQAADQLASDAGDARRRANSYASGLYRNGMDPTLLAVLSGNVTSIADVPLIRRTLNQGAELQQADLVLLTQQEATLRDLADRHQSATTAAQALQSGLDDELARLQADAADSATRLEAALADLRAKEAAAAAALAASTSGGDGATCDGTVPDEAINGFLPAGALCRLRTAPAHRLVAPAAEAFDRMSTIYAGTFGTLICVTDSYRDYAGQVAVFRSKPNLAATPGRSQHGWGRALDLCGGVQRFGTPEFQWLKENAPSFGFVHPDWAEPGGSKPEAWHWEYQG